MTDRSHERFDRTPQDLDELTAERLVRGLDAADAPPAYRGVAELIGELRGPGTVAELADEAFVVDDMAVALAPRRRRRLAPKIAALAVAGAFLSTAGVAAAVTGSLPSALTGSPSRPVVEVSEHEAPEPT